MKTLGLILALAFPLLAVDYVDGTQYLGALGVTTVTINNSGNQGGSRTIIMPIDGSHRFLWWASFGGYSEHGAVSSLTTTNTGVSGCTVVNATWPGGGRAKGNITSGAVASWTIKNPGNDYVAAPTVTTTNTGCSQTPAATAVIPTPTTYSTALSMDLQLVGPPTYFYEVVDSSGNRQSPRVLSGPLKIAQFIEPCETTPFTVFKSVHGVGGYTNCVTFSTASGVTTSNARLWLKMSNARSGILSVAANSGSFKTLDAISVLSATCTSGTCSFVTLGNHGLTNGQVAQLNGFRQFSSLSPATNLWMNDLWTVTVTGSKTFTIAASEHSISPDNGTWAPINSPANQPGTPTVSANVRLSDEMRWFGGIRGNRQAVEMMVPLGASAISAGSNTIYFRKTGSILENGAHGDWDDIDVVEGTDIECSQIVVSGTGATHLNAVATCNSHGYSDGDTIRMQSAPGPFWRFGGRRVITAHTTNTITFLWGPEFVGTAGSGAYTTPNGTYVVPTTTSSVYSPTPHMYVTRSMITKSSFQAYDPSTQTTYGGNVSNGNAIWNGTAGAGRLKDPHSYFTNHASISHCSSCHMKDAYDLKYWGWNERTIIVAGVDRGLTLSDAKDVAAFVLSNSVTTPTNGRPWSPTFQPGCAISSAAAANWAAGCGLDWVLTYDYDEREYLVPSGSYASWKYSTGLNLQNLPLPLQMQHWMKWLPEISPLDFSDVVLGIDFTTQPLWTDFLSYQASMTPGDITTYAAAGNYLQNLQSDFATFSLAYSLGNNAAAFVYPSEYQYQFYGVKKWQAEKVLELILTNQDQVLYDQSVTALHGASNARVPAMDTRGIYLWRMVFDNGAHIQFPGGYLNFEQGNSLVNTTNWTFDTGIWYLESMILDPGNGKMYSIRNTDTGYYQDFNFGFSSLLGRPYMYIDLMQSANAARQTFGWATPDLAWEVFEMIDGANFPPYFANLLFLTSTGDRTDILQGIADTWADDVGAFTTGQWQDWVDAQMLNNSSPHGTRASPADPAACASATTRNFPQSCLALFLAVANSNGVTATPLNTLATWGNAVFNSLSNRFTTDKTATGCVFSATNGLVSGCSNF